MTTHDIFEQMHHKNTNTPENRLARCYHCFSLFVTHDYDEDRGILENGCYVCHDCMDLYYHYCNGCGKIGHRIEFNNEYYCRECWENDPEHNGYPWEANDQ